MQRFFLLDQQFQIGQIADLSPLAHQLHTVLRLPIGREIMLLDNSGQAFLTEITHLARKQAMGRVLNVEPATGEPHIQLTLYQCALKADKFEWVLQKGTELGVTRFVPVISQRSIVRPAAALLKKYDRWHTIIREAAEQSRRGRLPLLDAPLTWQAAMATAQGPRFLPWETSGRSCSLGQALSEMDNSVPSASLLIGPEGGVTKDEVESASDAGWQIVSLGPRILRAETAALASITIVMERAGGF